MKAQVLMAYTLRYRSVDLKKCYVLLCFINTCYSHCYIPKEMMKGNAALIIKDIKGNASDSSNCMPVLVSLGGLKLLKIHFFDVFKEKCVFNCSQFGFTEGLSIADVFLSLLFSIIFLYIRQHQTYTKTGGAPYAVFMDFSDALDNVNHLNWEHFIEEGNFPT